MEPGVVGTSWGHTWTLTWMFKSQRVPPFNPVTTSCIVQQAVPRTIDKDGRMFCGEFWKKSVSYNTYNSDSSSWILNGLVSSCFDKCWYLWWRKRVGKGVLYIKPRVEATKPGHFAVRESARGQKLHLNDMYVVYISCFHSALRLKTYVEGTYMLNLLLPRFIDNREK